MAEHDLPWITRQAREILATQRGHALLLQGPQGLGHWPLAMAVASAWLCEAPGRSPEAPACGHCAACRLVSQRTHPDLRLIVPEAGREEAGLPSDETTGPADEGRKRKPSREIRIEQVRSALGFGELTASRSGLKVLVIHPADAVNTVSANALLKSLEEPAGALRYILTSATPDRLLPTIRSRCQAVRIDAPRPEEAMDWLVGQGLDHAAARVLLEVSGGQPLLALEHERAGRTAAVWAELPNLVRQQDSATLGSWPLPVLIEALQRLAHDASCRAHGAPARYFAQDGSAPADARRVMAWWRELAQVARHAEHPWQGPLSVEALLQRASAALAPPASQNRH